MKKIILITIFLLLSLSTVGCVNKTSQIEVVDMVGDKIKITKNPSKVACVSRTTYDLLVAFGLGDKIDGAYKGTLKNEWLNYIYPKSKEHYQYGYKDSYELFLSRQVDLVFAPEKYIAQELRDHGINAICISLYGSPEFDNYLTFFSNLIAKIWDSPEVKNKVNKWNSEIKQTISDIQLKLNNANVPKQKIYYVRGDKDKGIEYTDQKGSFIEFAYRILNLDYLGSRLATNKPQYEEIIKLNPDIITLGGIYQNKNIQKLKDIKYQNLNAVKNNKIFNIPIGLTALEQLNALSPVFFYQQGNLIYPELFNYDLNKIIKEKIKNYFNFDISDEKINYMLNGLNPIGLPLIWVKK